MKAGEVVFQELLNGKIQYRVPLFQRTYSWTEENWQRLWDDLLEVYALERLRTHFLGAVVTLPMPDSPEHVAKFMLIDGQQRLATLFILLSVIRDRATAAGLQTLADQIDEECLTNKFATLAEEKHKLRPTQQDLAAFSSVIARNGNDQSTRVGLSRSFFEIALDTGDLEGTTIDLSKLKTCITNYLALVSIRLDQDDSPHRIFESLNNTGMALTASDLVRNHLFMQIPDEEVLNRAYNRHWMPMQKSMEYGKGDSNLSDFFWRYLMKDGDLPRYDEVYEAMKTHIDERTSRGEPVVDILAELKEYRDYYVRLWRPDQHETHEDVRLQMERLNQWQVDVAYPFLLWAMPSRHAAQIDDEDFLQILRMIESYLVRRFVCGIPSNRLRRIFARMSRQIDASDFVESCRSYLIKNQWPSDEEFRDKFQTAKIYLASRLSRTRLVLAALERSFEHQEPVEMTGQITIEHIMPQTLSERWRESLGPNADVIYGKYLHTVGNLTYSGYNAEMGNIPFDQKKRILAES